MTKELTLNQQKELLKSLQSRFEKNTQRHHDMKWANVQVKLEANLLKIWSLQQMELSGGEPDVVEYDKKTDTYTFYDCSSESPKDRRSLCYDREALDARKKNKPKGNAMEMADKMGIEMLTEEQYRMLQKLGTFDSKSSSWLKTPPEIRKLEGAIFADFRFDRVFVYHNGVESYYAGRGFRGALSV